MPLPLSCLRTGYRFRRPCRTMQGHLRRGPPAQGCIPWPRGHSGCLDPPRSHCRITPSPRRSYRGHGTPCRRSRTVPTGRTLRCPTLRGPLGTCAPPRPCSRATWPSPHQSTLRSRVALDGNPMAACRTRLIDKGLESWRPSRVSGAARLSSRGMSSAGCAGASAATCEHPCPLPQASVVDARPDPSPSPWGRGFHR